MDSKLEQLKQDWLKDPHWDIETTEGFEAHTEELKAFRLEKKAEWDAEHQAKEAARFVRTVCQRISGSSTVREDQFASDLMKAGWRIINVSIISYIDSSGDWPVAVVERYITLERQS